MIQLNDNIWGIMSLNSTMTSHSLYFSAKEMLLVNIIRLFMIYLCIPRSFSNIAMFINNVTYMLLVMHYTSDVLEHKWRARLYYFYIDF